MREESKAIHVVVPVYNAETHIVSFLQSLEIALTQLNLRFRTTLVNDGSVDDTLNVLQNFVATSKVDSWQIVGLTERVGQQMAIWNGLSTNREHEVLVIIDDDMVVSFTLLGALLNPVLSGINDLVVAQQSARGIRRLTSGLYWFAHQKFSKRKFEGRDLMLRAVSPALVAKIISGKKNIQSISETTERISKTPSRISGINVTFLRSDSRYSSFDRFKLFVDLILVRRRSIGYMIMLAGLIIIGISSVFTVLAAMLGMISINSPGTLLALFIIYLGSINLLIIGLVQVSLVALLDETGN